MSCWFIRSFKRGSSTACSLPACLPAWLPCPRPAGFLPKPVRGFPLVHRVCPISLPLSTRQPRTHARKKMRVLFLSVLSAPLWVRFSIIQIKLFHKGHGVYGLKYLLHKMYHLSRKCVQEIFFMAEVAHFLSSSSPPSSLPLYSTRAQLAQAATRAPPQCARGRADEVVLQLQDRNERSELEIMVSISKQRN